MKKIFYYYKNLMYKSWFNKIFLFGLITISIAYIIWEIFWFLTVGSSAIKVHTYIFVITIILFLIAPRIKSRFILKYGIFTSFTIFSLIIGENHPFTTVPMYDSLPQQTIVIYLKRSNENGLPITRYRYLQPDVLTHSYYSLINTNNFQEVHFKDYEKIGESLLNSLLFPVEYKMSDTIFLVQKTVFINTESKIEEKDEILAYKIYEEYP